MLIVQTILGIVLVMCIVLQARGAGIGSVLGGGGEFYGTRRGIEKLLFRLTIVIAVCFIGVSLISVLR